MTEMLPMTGSEAWAALPGIAGTEVLDSHNGIPSLGLLTLTGGQRCMFWRLYGYGESALSIWMYVPLTKDDEQWLRSADVLAGLVLKSPEARFVILAVASDYRIVFEREWQLPAGLSGERLLAEAAVFLNEAMQTALDEGLPPTRAEMVREASRAVRELAEAGAGR